LKHLSDKNNNAACAWRTSIGGQALIEGILMRGPEKQAIVVRNQEGGLERQVKELTLIKDKYPILGWPLIRGTVNFISSMVNGVKALSYSASFFPDDETEQPSKLDKWLEDHLSSEKAEKAIVAVSVFLGIALSVGLFILLPTLLAGIVGQYIEQKWIVNILEGVLRITIFVGYMWLVSRMNDIRRVWMYHGAEHKTIACYESGDELTVENARKHSRFHPRCGTSFMFLVMIVSILVFSVVSWKNVFIRMVMRIALLPIVVGISYELIKVAGRYDNIVTRIISAPGKALQHITTAEPDDSMLEVAIEAMKEVIPEEKGADKW
jgi:uncharacterized protein YqhQ